jgi:hypothetical protein
MRGGDAPTLPAPRPHAEVPERPFGVGQRVLCAVDTLAPGRRDDFRGEQLYGRAGIVHVTHWDGWNRRWDVLVTYDHLTYPTMGGQIAMAHRPGEFRATGASPNRTAARSAVAHRGAMLPMPPLLLGVAACYTCA